MLICTYCGEEKTMDDLSCCGESCMHFIDVCDDCEEEYCVCLKECPDCGKRFFIHNEYPDCTEDIKEKYVQCAKHWAEEMWEYEHQCPYREL